MQPHCTVHRVESECLPPHKLSKIDLQVGGKTVQYLCLPHTQVQTNQRRTKIWSLSGSHAVLFPWVHSPDRGNFTIKSRGIIQMCFRHIYVPYNLMEVE